MKSLFYTSSLLVLLTACATVPAPVSQEQNLSVVASFYPLAFLAGEVGGEHATVTQLAPHGTEPHDYEPTPGDILTLEKAQVFLFNGSGLDPWAERAAEELNGRGVKTVRFTDGVSLLSAVAHGHEDEEEAGEHADEQDEAGTDPHIWLDPVIMAEKAVVLAEAFAAADPAHAAAYRVNAARVSERLETLDEQYRLTLRDCAKNEIVVSHNAYSYLAKRYGFAVHALAGLSPEDEPSPARMAEIAREAKEDGVEIIFFETLVSPKLARTIADEIGAETAVLNPAEGLTLAQVDAGADYVSILEENLAMLASALVCTQRN